MILLLVTLLVAHIAVVCPKILQLLHFDGIHSWSAKIVMNNPFGQRRSYSLTSVFEASISTQTLAFLSLLRNNVVWSAWRETPIALVTQLNPLIVQYSRGTSYNLTHTGTLTKSPFKNCMFGCQRLSTKGLFAMCHGALSRTFVARSTESKVKRKKPLSEDKTSDRP